MQYIIAPIMTEKITIKNLSIAFSQQTSQEKILSDISFEIKLGEITSLIGHSGCGKSSIALSLMGLLRKAEISGEINYDSKNLVNLGEEEWRKIRGQDISIVFQDPNSALNPLHKVGKQIKEAVLAHNNSISRSDLTKRLQEVFKLIGISELFSRIDDFPHQFSGGQKQRLMIAMALINNPKILILDEPTTALDSKSQNQILDLIVKLKKELGLTILFISHNLNIVKKIADQIIVLNDKKILQIGNVKEIFDNPKHEYVKKLVKIAKSNEEFASLDRHCEDFQRKSAAIQKEVGGEILRVTDLSVSYGKKSWGFFDRVAVILKGKIKTTPPQASPATPLAEGNHTEGELRVDLDEESLPSNGGTANSFAEEKQKTGLPRRFASRNDELALKNLSFCLKKSQNLGITGQSGSGKSTLAKALMNLVKYEGKIDLLSSKNHHQFMQITFQDPFSSLNPRFLIKDIVLEGLKVQKILKKSDNQDKIAGKMLEKLGLDKSLLYRYPHQLSGGQRQRVAISRSLILQPEILILDEPTSALDFIAQDELLNLLLELQKDIDIAYIVISHDLAVINRLCHKVIELEYGKVKK